MPTAPTPRLGDDELARVEQALLQGATAHGFTGELWTLEPDRLARAAAADPGVAAVLTVLPNSSPQDQATTDLVKRFCDQVIPTARGDSGAQIYVGGLTATIAQRVQPASEEASGCLVDALLHTIGRWSPVRMDFREIPFARARRLRSYVGQLARRAPRWRRVRQ